MNEWKRHIDCDAEIKDYFVLVCDNDEVCEVFLNGNNEWCIKRSLNIDICDSRSQAFDFAEGSFNCEGIKRIRNRR